MRKYFGFAISDSMFSGNISVTRNEMTAQEVKSFIGSEDVIACLNPSHTATIDAMQRRFGIEIAIPSEPPKVSLNTGDTLVVMTVRGLGRLTDRHEYTAEEIERASFTFARWDIE